MATSAEATGVVYERYATYHTLENLSIQDPELWMNLVDHALDDLHSHYEFSGEEYPLEAEFETTFQKKGRWEIVKEWRVVFKGWKITKEQRASILTMLFYAIWAQDIATGKQDLTTGHPTFSSAYVRKTTSRNYNHVRLVDTSPTAQNTATERLQPDIQLTEILQHLLKKAVEKFGKRYSGWLKEHPNAVEELSSFLRPEVRDICKEVGKDGFTSEQRVQSISY
jgi:hypothetical protein